ncbi:hypothetical protein AAY473_023917, partial [Plecturocebus cupreus]
MVHYMVNYSCDLWLSNAPSASAPSPPQVAGTTDKASIHFPERFRISGLKESFHIGHPNCWEYRLEYSGTISDHCKLHLPGSSSFHCTKMVVELNIRAWTSLGALDGACSESVTLSLGWSAVEQTWLTATSASRVQAIPLPQPLEYLGLQACATMP